MAKLSNTPIYSQEGYVLLSQGRVFSDGYGNETESAIIRACIDIDPAGKYSFNGFDPKTMLDMFETLEEAIMFNRDLHEAGAFKSPNNASYKVTDFKPVKIKAEAYLIELSEQEQESLPFIGALDEASSGLKSTLLNAFPKAAFPKIKLENDYPEYSIPMEGYRPLYKQDQIVLLKDGAKELLASVNSDDDINTESKRAMLQDALAGMSMYKGYVGLHGIMEEVGKDMLADKKARFAVAVRMYSTEELEFVTPQSRLPEVSAQERAMDMLVGDENLAESTKKVISDRILEAGYVVPLKVPALS